MEQATSALQIEHLKHMLYGEGADESHLPEHEKAVDLLYLADLQKRFKIAVDIKTVQYVLNCILPFLNN